MLLRRVTKHVTDQNWFAVFIDFTIVVVGILIAFQFTEWNERQQANKREQLVLGQLHKEFTDIKSAIEKQNTIRNGYIKSLRHLIKTLEGEEAADDLTVKKALDAARSTGRRPPQSAAYLQLMASGELTMLSSEELQKTLISYDVLLKRDAFIFPVLMDIVTEEISSNPYVDLDINGIVITGAAIDHNEDDTKQLNETIKFYDLDGLRSFESRYETLFIINTTILGSDSMLLELVNEVLKQISKSQ
jgi:hypothetical protein